jgi:hypothetical protein
VLLISGVASPNSITVDENRIRAVSSLQGRFGTLASLLSPENRDYDSLDRDEAVATVSVLRES